MYRVGIPWRTLLVRCEQTGFSQRRNHHRFLAPLNKNRSQFRHSVITHPLYSTPIFPVITQPHRSVYNPFDSEHTNDDAEENLELNRQQKRRKLQESRHSTHSPYTSVEEDAGDSILYKDVRIVGWSPEEIYDVVMNVGEYTEFIPYCIKSAVQTKSSTKRHDFMEADLQVGFNLYQLSYTSKVNGSTTLDGKKLITAVCENKDLFDHLNMEWAIEPGPVEHTSSMHFDVSFRFSNKFYNSVATLFKSSVIDQMIPAFEARLREIHGEPTILSSLAASKIRRRKKRR